MTQLKGKLLADNTITGNKLSDILIEDRHLSDNAKDSVLNHQIARIYQKLTFVNSLGTSDDLTPLVYDASLIKRFHGNENTEGIMSDDILYDKCLLRLSLTRLAFVYNNQSVYGRLRVIDTLLSGTISQDLTTLITGTNTFFTSELVLNDIILLPDNTYRKVISITDDTHLTLDTVSNTVSSGSANKINCLIDYKYFNNGENNYTFLNVQSIDILFPEGIGLDKVDYGFSTEYLSWNQISSASTAYTTYPQYEIVATENIMPELDYTPVGDSYVKVEINGFSAKYNDHFTFSGTTGTWKPGVINANYTLAVGDEIYYSYPVLNSILGI